MNKIQEDVLAGRNRRLKTIAILNQAFAGSFYFELVHKHYNIREGKLDSRVEKFLKNRLDGEGLGLHVLMLSKKHTYQIPFIFMYESAGVYFKAPKDLMDYPTQYLEYLVSFNYHVLMIEDRTEPERYHLPFSVKAMLGWKWSKAPSFGSGENRNRINIGGLTNRRYFHLKESLLIGPSVFEGLKNLWL